MEKVPGTASSPFIMYPNPARSGEELKVEWRVEEGEYRWEIFDVAGRPVKTGEINISSKSTSFSLPLPAVPAGTYVLQFRNRKGRTFSGKFIVL